MLIASPLNEARALIALNMSLQDRITEAIQHSGRKPAEIARAIKKTPSAISQLMDGTTKSLKADTASGLERETGYRANWLISGVGPKRLSVANIETAPPGRRVPIISWVQAGSWSEVQDNFLPGEADDWAIAFDTLPGKSAFALVVSGDSMTSPYPGELSFPEGTIIIVDPDRECDAGSFVIAKDVDTQKATFKKLTHDAGRWYLKPLNPAYPIMEIDDPSMRVIGRVTEFQTRGKL